MSTWDEYETMDLQNSYLKDDPLELSETSGNGIAFLANIKDEPEFEEVKEADNGVNTKYSDVFIKNDPAKFSIEDFLKKKQEDNSQSNDNAFPTKFQESAPCESSCKYCEYIYQDEVSKVLHLKSAHNIEDHQTFEAPISSREKELTFKKLTKVKKKLSIRLKSVLTEDVLDESETLLKAEFTIDEEGQGHCNRCGLIYSKKSTQLYHLKRTHNLGHFQFKCDICQMDFLSNSTLGAHIRRSHIGKSDTEDKQLNDVSFYENGLWYCSICSMNYKSQHLLLIHQNKLHGITLSDMKYKCQLCDCRFCSSNSLRTHVKRKHGDTLNLRKSSNIPLKLKQVSNNNDVISSISNTWNCNICEFQNVSISNVYYHVSEEHEPLENFSYKCVLCEMYVKAFKELTEHLMYKHNKNVQNLGLDINVKGDSSKDIEFQSFDNGKDSDLVENDNPDDLVKSETTLDKGGVWHCNRCDLTYVKKHLVLYHLKRAHNIGHFAFKCPYCHMEYTCKTALTGHIRRSHLDESDNNTDSPNSNFSVDQAGIFHCNRCGLTYSKKYLLFYHLKRVHNIGEFEFKCTLCEMEFTSNATLTAHIRRNHVKKKIDDDKLLGNMAVFKNNIWHCTLCEMTYFKKASLRLHLFQQHAIATEDIKYECKVCHAKFITVNSRRSHILRKHNNSDAPVIKLNTKPPVKLVSSGTDDFKGCSENSTTDGRQNDSKIHIILLQDDVWSCSACGVQSTRILNISSHLQSIHGQEEGKQRVYSCSLCGEDFPTLSVLTTHWTTKHTNANQRNYGQQCQFCHLSFKCLEHLQIHVSTVHVGTTFNLDLLDVDTKIKLELTDCDTAGSESGNGNILLNSLIMRENCSSIVNDDISLDTNPSKESDVPVNCELAEDDLAREELDMHQIGKESASELSDADLTIDGVRQCNSCGYILSSGKNLIEHIQNTHPVEFESIEMDLQTSVSSEEFKCAPCGQSYSNVTAMAQHMEEHVSKGDAYNCVYCEHVSASQMLLRQHFVDSHCPVNNAETESKLGENSKWKCELCNLDFIDIIMFVEHILSNHGNQSNVNSSNRNFLKGFECAICRLVFSSRQGLTSHEVENHHNLTTDKSCIKGETLSHTKYECGVCSLVTISPSLLLAHMKAKHYTLYKSITQCSTSHPRKSIDSKSNFLTYTCYFCGNKFASTTSYRQHLHTKHRSTSFVCRHCHVLFPTHGKLAYHYRKTHYLIKPYTSPNVEGVNVENNLNNKVVTTILEHEAEVSQFQCNVCGVGFVTKKLLLTHNSRKHPDLKKFECSLCEFSSKDRYNLKSHLASKHPESDLSGNLQQYMCEECGFTSTSFTTFKTHMSLHKIKYKCEHCDYTSARRTSIVVHRRTHTNTKPYVCTFEGCNYRATQRTCLKLHMWRHYPDKYMQHCKDCDFKTINKYMMMKHLKEHENGVKGHACTFCSYTSNNINNLKMHMTTHQAPMLCPLCDYNSKYNQCLRNHLKKKHGLSIPLNMRVDWSNPAKVLAIARQ